MPTLELVVASGAALDVRRFLVREAVSEPFVVEVTARCDDPALDLDAIVGFEALFRIQSGLAHASHRERRWNGVCRAASLERAEPSGLSTYRFEIAAPVWVLSQTRDHRIFQHLTAVDIALAVLAEHQVPREIALDPAAQPRLPYKVQYAETDYAFLSRILEEAGLAFTHPEGSAGYGVLTLSDALHAAEPRAVTYDPSPNESSEEEFVTDLRFSDEVRPGAATVRDHDFTRPATPIFADADKAPGPEGELLQTRYRPGAFLIETAPTGATPHADDRGAMVHDLQAGRRLAQRGLRAEREGKRAIAYRTNILDLWPGRVITLSAHPHPDLAPERRLLVTHWTLEGAPGESFTMLGRAVPAEEAHRPPQKTPRPRARLQSATVVGPYGEDIHTDEHGRVRVRFPWDRAAQLDTYRTPWIRVSQGWAGAGYGLMALPRVDQEVLVDFLGGDPEQPVVVGRLHNQQNPVIERLPDHRTRSIWRSRSTDGFNELLFEDKKGEELLHEQSQRDQRRLVKHDDTSTVEGNRAKLVTERELETTEKDRLQVTDGERLEITDRHRTTATEGTRRDRVKVDHVERLEVQHLLSVGKDRHLITSGEKRELVEEGQHLFIGGERAEAVGGTFYLAVGKGYEEKVGSYSVMATGEEGTIHLASGSNIVLDSDADVTLLAGGNFVKAGGGVVITGSEVLINESGSEGSLPGAGQKLPEPPEEAVVREPRREDAVDTLVLEWPETLTPHLPGDLQIRLDLGERHLTLRWIEGEVRNHRRRLVFEHVTPGARSTLVAVSRGSELILWNDQRANDPEDPPTFEHWVEELVIRPHVPADIEDVGPMNVDEKVENDGD